MGTHPIFESDFDCLTDRYQTSLNYPKWTDSTLSKSSMVANTLWVAWPPPSPSACSRAKRLLSSVARVSSSPATSTVTSSRCSSTSSVVCSPTRPIVARLPSRTSRPSRASPPHDKVRRALLPSCYREIKLKPNRKYAPVGRLAAETGWKYQDVIATLEAKRKAKAELYWENKQKKKALKDQAAANVASKTAAIDAQLAELGY